MKLFPVSVLVIFMMCFVVNVCGAAVTSDASKPVYKPELLEEVIKLVQKTVAEKQIPVVVFDLDSTLFNNTPRNHA